MWSRTPFFLPVGQGQRFCILDAPREGGVRGTVLFVHPFAEEMNKSRRMVSLQSERLAAAGYAVLRIDLLGCGDSSGDFGDASWDAWREDILAAITWLQANYSGALALWGLRAGCLLAASVAVDLEKRPNFIFWQPVLSGKPHWTQFTRLKTAGALGNSKETLDRLKQQLAAGENVEIAGYSIAASLAEGLAGADLLPIEHTTGKFAWFEISSRPDATVAPASRSRIEQWQQCGWAGEAAVVSGPPFWQTTEIETAPALIEATLSAVERWQ